MEIGGLIALWEDEVLRHHKKKYFLQEISKSLRGLWILEGLFPTVS